MLPPESPTAGTPAPAEAQAEADPLDQAARAILGYLDDLAACRERCLRHAPSTSARIGPAGLRLLAAAELTPEGEPAHIRAVVEALPSAGCWHGEPVRENGSTTCRQKVIARHVLWEGESLHVAVLSEGFGLLRVEVSLPDRPEWPRHPLRVAASALRFVEHLLPPMIARAVPLSELPEAPLANLLESLRRATPENLPSSQCIWPAPEGQSSAPDTAPPATP